jgi:hypothetical protein
MRPLFVCVAIGLVGTAGLRAADSPPSLQTAVRHDVPERPKSELEIENEALRAARTAAPSGSNGLGWYVVLVAATLVGGLSLLRDTVRRRRRARAIREAVAVPVLRPVAPLAAGGLLLPGDSADADPPPSRPQTSGAMDGS